MDQRNQKEEGIGKRLVETVIDQRMQGETVEDQQKAGEAGRGWGRCLALQPLVCSCPCSDPLES